MTEHMYVKLGDTSVPLVPSAYSFETGFGAIDEGSNRLLRLFEAAIVAELGDAWERVFGENSSCPSTHPLHKTTPVMDRIGEEPTLATMQARSPRFPLLTLHREPETRVDDPTLEHDGFVTRWQLNYIMGGLSTAQQIKVGDVLRFVAIVVSQVIRRRGHPAFEGGAAQFFDTVGGFASIRCTGWSTGRATFVSAENAPSYLMVTIGLETMERSADDPSALPVLDGADVGIAAGGENDVLPHVADVTLE